MLLFKLSRSARRILASRALECLQYDYFIRHFLFDGRKEMFPISSQQYYDFHEVLIVELFTSDFNWAKFPRMWKISSHNFDTALLIINLN